MKNISDILNSMVQPADQNPLMGSQVASSKGPNSSVGSFGDVLSRLAAQNAALSNTASGSTNNNTTPNTNPQNSGSVNFSDTQLTITEVQVSEKVQSGNLDSTTLKNIENSVVSMAMALSQLVQLASNLQNINPAQAQNLLVSASGGALSSKQVQQLVAQITALKTENGGQNPLSLTPGQQNSLLAQLMQTMLQNQQITLTASSNTQSGQNFSSTTPQGSSLQFNFTGNQGGQNGGVRVTNLSVNIETLDLQIANLNLSSQGGADTQAANLTNDTTQRLTQLLQQLNVTPSSTPVNIQVQSSVATTNSPQLAQNFQNLVQILTQAGAGQAVLSNYLTQNKNNQTNNLQQTLNQPTQNQNVIPVQSAAVTGVSPTGSANLALISSNAQNLSNGSLVVSKERLSVSANDQNFEIQDVQLQAAEIQIQPETQSPTQNSLGQLTNNQTQSVLFAGNVQALEAPIANQNTPTQPANNQNQPTTLVVNVQASQTPVVGQNAPVQPANDQTQPTTPAINVQVPQVPIAAQSIPVQPTNNPTQLTAPVVNFQVPQTPILAQNTSVQPTTNQTQPTAPVVNVQVPQAPIVPQNTPGQSTNNPTQPTAPVVNVQVPQAPVVEPNTPIQPSNNQTQPAAPAVNIPAPQAPVAPVTTQNTPPVNNPIQPTIPVVNAQAAQNQATNPTTQATVNQNQEVFSSGQIEALNNIVARFNSAVVQSSPADANTLNANSPTNPNTIGNPASNTVGNPVSNVVGNPAVNPTVNQPEVTPVVAPIDQNVSVANVTLAGTQNTQQSSGLTQNNLQNQLVQPTSPIAQQVNVVLANSTQNAFVQTGVNTTANNGVNSTVPVPPTILNSAPTSNLNQTAPIATVQAPVQQVVTANQATVQTTVPTSSSASAPIPTTVQAPVITQPVTTPASITAQNVLAATVIGEVAKASVPPQTPTNAPVANNAPVVENVSAVQAVQPATVQAVTQAPSTTASTTGFNVATNSNSNNSADTAGLQSLISAVNSSVVLTSDKQNANFQTVVNTVSSNNNPNGSVDGGQILNQISQQVAAQTADAKMVSRLSFQLVPESLGRVTVQVALVDQSISARIVVTNSDVREVLQQHMVDLKAALSQAGLQIDQMQVHVQGGGANLLAQYYQYQQEGNSYRDSAWTPSQTAEEALNMDNSTIFSPSGSNALVNILA